MSDERHEALQGLTVTEAVAYLMLGDRRHGDAPSEECGYIDPRNVSLGKGWCRRPNDGRCGKQGWHNSFRLDEDWGERA